MTFAQRGPVGVGVPSVTWGRGFSDLIKPAAPPAGQAVRHVIPSSANEIVLTACATLTASATVASRFPVLTLQNGDGFVFASFAATTAVVASGVVTVTWALGANIPGGAGNASPTVPLTEIIMPAGFAVSIGAIGLDGADQLSNVALYLLHIPTGPTGPPQGTANLTDTSGPYSPGASLTVDVTG